MSSSVMQGFEDALDPLIASELAEVGNPAHMEASETRPRDGRAHNFPRSEASDARADVPISETAERFLRALVTRVPLDRIEELYLFAPLRQGAVETGIAVVAARTHVDVPEQVPPFESPATDPPSVNPPANDPPSVEPPAVDPPSIEPPANDPPSVEPPAVDPPSIEPPANGAQMTGAPGTEILPGDVRTSGNAGYDDDSPYAPEPAFALNEFIGGDDAAVTYTAPVRHTVYTARYRLVVKGPDRGKWEIDVVDEADAPLLTVETVVRGVQRRAGEETATVRFNAVQLSQALRLPNQPVL